MDHLNPATIDVDSIEASQGGRSRKSSILTSSAPWLICTASLNHLELE